MSDYIPLDGQTQVNDGSSSQAQHRYDTFTSSSGAWGQDTPTILALYVLYIDGYIYIYFFLKMLVLGGFSEWRNKLV